MYTSSWLVPLVVSLLIIGGPVATAQDIAPFDEVEQAVTALHGGTALTPPEGDIATHPDTDADRVWAEALIRLQNLIARTQADEVLDAAQNRLASAIDTVETYLAAEVTVVVESDDTVDAESAPVALTSEPDDPSAVISRHEPVPTDSGLETQLGGLQQQALEIQCALERWIVDVEALRARQDGTAAQEE